MPRKCGAFCIARPHPTSLFEHASCSHPSPKERGRSHVKIQKDWRGEVEDARPEAHSRSWPAMTAHDGPRFFMATKHFFDRHTQTVVQSIKEVNDRVSLRISDVGLGIATVAKYNVAYNKKFSSLYK